MIRLPRVAVILIAALLCPGGVLAGGSAEEALPRAHPAPDLAATPRPRDAPDGWDSPRAARGVKVGAIVGGVAGAGFLVFIAALTEGLCDAAVCDKNGAAGYVGLALFGGSFGAAVGGLLGGGVAAHARPEPEEQAPSTPLPHRRGPSVSFSLQPGIAISSERPGLPAEFMMKGLLAVQVTPWIAVGPELSRSKLSGGFTGLEGVVRLGPSCHAFYPYLVGGLGLRHWHAGPDGKSVDLTGTGVGGGLSWTVGEGRWRVGLESRYQWPLRDIEGPFDYRFMFAGGTARMSW